MANDRHTIGIVGARGHTGAELIRLVAAHPSLELAFVSSRELGGQRVDGHNAVYTGDLCYENLDPQAVAGLADHIVKFWDPRMKAMIAAHLTAGGEGLEPLAREALAVVGERTAAKEARRAAQR